VCIHVTALLSFLVDLALLLLWGKGGESHESRPSLLYSLIGDKLIGGHSTVALKWWL